MIPDFSKVMDLDNDEKEEMLKGEFMPNDLDLSPTELEEDEICEWCENYSEDCECLTMADVDIDDDENLLSILKGGEV